MELKTFENYDLYSFDLKETLLKCFESQKIEKYAYLNKENSKWFLYQVNSEKENEVLMEIFNHPHDAFSYHVENFIDDVIERIDELLYGIKIKKRDILQQKEELRNYSKVLENLKYENQNESSNANEEIRISYAKQKDEIFKKYHLKYKAKIGIFDFKSIYSESSQKKCIFSNNESIDKIEVKILGKNKNFPAKEFAIISTIDLPIIEVYTSIKPEQFLLFDPPSIYLIISYENKLEFYDTDHHLELKFDLKISETQKIQIIKKIIEFIQLKISRLEASVEKREKMIKNIINPFENFIGYEGQKGFFKKNEGIRCCYVYNCTLF